MKLIVRLLLLTFLISYMTGNDILKTASLWVPSQLPETGLSPKIKKNPTTHSYQPSKKTKKNEKKPLFKKVKRNYGRRRKQQVNRKKKRIFNKEQQHKPTRYTQQKQSLIPSDFGM